MSLDTLDFLVLISLSVATFYALPFAWWRKATLLATSSIFIYSFFPTVNSLAPLLLNGSLVIFSIYLLANWPKKQVLFLSISTLIIFFLLVKFYFPIPIFGRSVFITVGISYILFRAIQVYADLYEGFIQRKDLDPLELVLFLFSFLTFSTGPIQRFDVFQEQISKIEITRFKNLNFPQILPRAVLGYFKLVTLSPIAIYLHQVTASPSEPALIFAISALAFLGYIYLNFSGSIDILIALGQIFGFQLPENFNQPYLATNFLDIWNRWHMSLADTYKNYVFFPLIRTFKKIPLLKKSHILPGVMAYYIVFFFVGIWHGSTPPYLIFGILLGLGASANKAYEQLRSYKTPPTQNPTFLNNLKLIFSSTFAISYFAFVTVSIWPSIKTITDIFIAYRSIYQTVIGILWMSLLIITIRGAATGLGLLWNFFKPSQVNKRLSKKYQYTITGLGIALVFVVKGLTEHQISTQIFYEQF